MNPSDILEDGASTFEKKDADYGASWRRAGEIMFFLTNGEPVTLETPEDWIAVGLFTRRMDKISRSIQSELVNQDLNHESTYDSHADEMVYAAMHAALRE